MYSDGQFRWRSNGNYSDDATCAGAMILFLNGIVPDSGSLAIPVIDETYEDWCSMFPAGEFRFDYAANTIRIPVWQGKINFIFGTDTASYTFPTDGVYEVHFSSDWNNVTSVRKVSMLDNRFSYIKPQSSVHVHNLNTELSYAGIQEAIDAAETQDGQTIHVDAGTYNENVVVDKSITLQGEDKETTIINGGGLSTTVEVTADNVTVTGFMIENSSKTGSPSACSGCLLSNVTGCRIFQNNIINNWNGISLNQCNGNVISENAITLNVNEGIRLQDSLNNSIYHNNFIDNAAQTGMSNSIDAWDDGYPSVGNYWSDYTERYPNATETDDSGIWNMPYILDGNNQDNYPLMFPVSPLDNTAPTIQILSPASITYPTTTIPLMFTLNEPASKIRYSLDGNTNVTVLGNATLNGVPNGSHSITVYATDASGNSASSTAQFSVYVYAPPNISVLPNEGTNPNTSPTQSTSPPEVSVNSQQNKTYETNSIPLTFTVNESISWAGYSLDGQENVTVTGNATIANLTAGSHRLTVSVKDAAGNSWSAETIYFSVAQEKTPEPSPEPFPTEWVATGGILVAVVAAAAFLLYAKKIRKK
jgi:parallel beta-helix repeat protein